MTESPEDAVPCGLASLRDDGTLLTANATLADMLGLPKDELIGRRLESFLNVAGRIFFQTHLMPLLRMSGRIEEAHVSLLDSSGNELPILLNATRRERDGVFISQVAIAPMRRRLQHEDEILAARRTAEAATREKDAAIAELRAFQAELEQRVTERTQELLAANAEMEGFTYSIAHDLRAPLRAISACASILLEEAPEALSEEHHSLLERQAANAVRLGQLIDDLLRFSRLSRMEFESVTVDLSSLVQSVIEEFDSVSMVSGCTFVIQPGMSVCGDPRLLRLVLSNLLHNACKFSPQGGNISVQAEDVAGETVYSVTDEGSGFDMQYADKLFLPFQRLVADHEFPGTGIGLANVQRIVRRHGGRVWAKSEVAKGSTFFFTLPELSTASC